MKSGRRKIRIALAQVNPVVGDLDGNEALIRRKIAEAKKLGVQLLAFPELILCGYPTEDLLLKTAFLEDCEERLARLAGHARGIAVVVGAPEMTKTGGHDRGTLYNTAPVLYRGRIAARYRKIHLPNYGVFDEKRYFARGDRALVVNFGDIPVGISICEDIWVDGGPVEMEAGEGLAEIVINISASPYHRRKGPERERLMQKRARENKVWLCYINLLGGQDELVFDASSVICSPDGKTVRRGIPFGEDMIIADIDLGRVGGKSSRAGSGGTVRPAEESRAGKKGKAAGDEVPYTLERVDLPSLPEKKSIRLPRRVEVKHPGATEEVYKALIIGTRDYVDKNGFDGVILGLSGGIDSALTAAVAVEALGPGRVKGVTMPSGFTSGATLSDARKLAANLEIELFELPIGRLYEEYLDLLGDVMPIGRTGIMEENIQARIRGNLLMAMSNRFGWLVLTTGNKSEVAVGYCTLYGDMAGGFAVLKDVPKTLVFSLSRYVNRVAGKNLIPPSTIKRKPSAELRPGQCDQDTLPPYPVLDRIIELYVENDMSLREITAKGIDPETAGEIIRMIDTNEYKRRQGPPGIKITPKAFGRDRRLPITNRYRPGGRR